MHDFKVGDYVRIYSTNSRMYMLGRVKLLNEKSMTVHWITSYFFYDNSWTRANFDTCYNMRELNSLDLEIVPEEEFAFLTLCRI